MVPFSDLAALHAGIEEELRQAFDRVLKSSAFVLGPEVVAFERSFAEYIGVEHCVGVNSGTAALHLALAALGVGPGDEVITVAHTFMATAEAITAVGARPVFVDIDPVSYTIDPQMVHRAITSRTRAILPVHLYGQAADMDPILEIAGRHGIAVVEDAAQAHGTLYKGRKAGSLGIAGCFSFFPGKNLGALGEGGAIVTNDGALAKRLRMWRQHGSERKYEHCFPAFNMRMNGLQGGFLAVKLRYLDRWNDQRRAAAARYALHLADAPVTLPGEMAYSRHVYHLYVIQCEDREILKRMLAETGIETRLHYPTPLHLQEAYRQLGYRQGDLPVTERIARRILSLPIFPGISETALERVSQTILAVGHPV
jgi:dTDP-4-amino-4,6-dideoxygalactose transaminase